MTVYHRDDSVVLHHGDCLNVLAAMTAESVDAIVTDPPYGLEFMGKDWDRFGRPQGPGYTEPPRWTPDHMGKGFDQLPNHYESGAPFQDWCRQWGEAVLRVAKPGAHLLAFGGTRTHHRLYCGLEDAGWEIRDTLAWIYGCLTDDAEILTDRGWRRGLDVQPGDLVAQWDPATEAVSLTPVQEKFLAPYIGPLVRFVNRDTDQILTPNHRVWHKVDRHRSTDGTRRIERDSTWTVAEAADVGRGRPLTLPLAGLHDGPGIGGDVYAALLGWIWTEGGFDTIGNGVRIYQSSVNPGHIETIQALLDGLVPGHKRYDQERTYTYARGGQCAYTATTWFFTGPLAERIRADLPGKRPTWGLLWRMTLAEKRALWQAAMDGDGSGQPYRCQQFHQKHYDDLEWFAALSTLTGRSARVGMRAEDTGRTGGACYVRQRGTTQLQQPQMRRCPPVPYDGLVWCVRVPTGAFIARRNGRTFVTGNSGFPKSLDVSKAIDKAAGATREVGPVDPARAGRLVNQQGDYATDAGWSAGNRSVTVDPPATPEAEQWNGWGTALKPAHEPILLARKPLSGTVADNVLRYGTGALNIDGTRVAAHGKTRFPTGDYGDRGLYGADGERTGDPNPNRRWPANVVLDEQAAAMLDAQTGTLTSGSRAAGVRSGMGYHGANGDGGPAIAGDSGGPSRFFYVAKAPRSEKPWQDGQVGKERCSACGGWEYGNPTCECDEPQWERNTEATMHPTVKPLDLMRWLVRLVTPPGGAILDPFAGTGTTAEAAVIEGFRCVLIEQDEGYCDLARRRLTKPIQPTLGL